MALLLGDCFKYLFIENIYIVAIHLGMAITNLAAGKYADMSTANMSTYLARIDITVKSAAL